MENKKTYIYIVSAKDGSQPWKIGQTQNLEARLASLQTGSPAKLKYVAYVEGESKYERILHAMFKESWVHGEWFHLDDTEQSKLLDALKAINENTFSFKFNKKSRTVKTITQCQLCKLNIMSTDGYYVFDKTARKPKNKYRHLDCTVAKQRTTKYKYTKIKDLPSVSRTYS